MLTRCAHSDRMRRPGGTEVGAENLFDTPAQHLARIVVRKLHTDTLGLAALRAQWRDPDHTPGNRMSSWIVHQLQQHEDLITQRVVFRGRHEQARIVEKRQVGRLQRGLGADVK